MRSKYKKVKSPSLSDLRRQGDEAEDAFFKAMNFYRGNYPDWLEDVSKAPEYLDRQSVDALVKVRGGMFYGQIKSTQGAYDSFVRQRTGIVCLLARVHERPNVIYERAIKVLEEEYRVFERIRQFTTLQRQQHIHAAL